MHDVERLVLYPSFSWHDNHVHHGDQRAAFIRRLVDAWNLINATMDTLSQDPKNKIQTVCIKEYEKIDTFVVYRIELHGEECNWIVLRRYREFRRLHEELVDKHGIAWDLLPPKKLVGNLKPEHIEKRKRLLEKYLKSVLLILDEYPKALMEFLELDQFDVHDVCQKLASDLYEIGDDLLVKGYIFKVTPLQIHCINRRLQLPLPTCESNSLNDDIGHLYSFIQQIPKILIHPGEELHLFIGQNELKYDLTVFKSLTYLEIHMCDVELIEGVSYLQTCLTEICVHRSLKLLKDILIGCDSWSGGISVPFNAGKEEIDSVISQLEQWHTLKRATFSYNDLQSIDYSIALLPNLKYLDLSHNLLTEVQYLEELTFLTELDLSYNKLQNVSEFPFRLPSVSKLNLAGNGIQDITGLEKMYALEELNLSNNKIETVTDVIPLGNLPILTSLHLKGNSLAEFHNHRVRIFAQFPDRAAEMLLDNSPPTKRELSKIRDMLASQDSFCIIPDNPFPVTKNKNSFSASPLSSSPKPKTSPHRSKVDSITPTDVSVTPPGSTSEDNGSGAADVSTPPLNSTLEDPAAECEVKRFYDYCNDQYEQSLPQIEPISDVVNKSVDVSNSADVTPSASKDEVVGRKIDLEGEACPTQISPHGKKKDRLAVIKSPNESKTEDECTSPVCDQEFREKVEKLQEHAGDEWLKYFNDFENNGSVDDEVDIDDADDEEDADGVFSSQQLFDVTADKGDVLTVSAECLADEEVPKTEPYCGGTVEVDSEEYEDVDDEMKVEMKQLIDGNLDLSKETFLLYTKDECGNKQECMITKDDHLIILIDICSGLQTCTYDLETVSGLSASKQNEEYCVTFEAKSGGKKSESAGTPTVEMLALYSKNTRDAAGVMLLLKSCVKKIRSNSKTSERSAASVNNPFSVSKTTLLDVLQDFLINKTITTAKNSDSNNVGCNEPSLLQVSSSASTSEDIALVQWVGCMPYLYPEEEIPVCVMITNFKVYLFRMFLSEKCTKDVFSTVKKSLHCFYDFQLCCIRELVIGVFDQSLRIEVAQEGPRGTFLFLTRDASKTSLFVQFLTMGKAKTERGSMLDIHQQRNSISDFPLVIYPDEMKIAMLKTKIQELGFEFEEAEHFLSYCIVYKCSVETVGCEMHEHITLPYLRTLILTDNRLLLCEEDYVRWPLPSYVASAPVTPQWIPECVENIESLIGVSIWEDLGRKLNMIGCFGMALKFEKKPDADVSDHAEVTWHVLFHSLAERQQFLRSLSGLWKNLYNVQLQITSIVTKQKLTNRVDSTIGFVKGHYKKLSGSAIPLPPTMRIDCPEMLGNVEKSRINSIFLEKIARKDDQGASGVEFVMCAGCKTYMRPGMEFNIALILGRCNIYLITAKHHAQYISANGCFKDEGDVYLYFSSIPIKDLKQVVVGLFDQCFRLETESPMKTFIIITRNSTQTNDFVKQLNHVIAQLPSNDETSRQTTEKDQDSGEDSADNIYQIYKTDSVLDVTRYPKLMHRNTSIQFMYPTDVTIDKLRHKIKNYIEECSMHAEAGHFGILLYIHLFHLVDRATGVIDGATGVVDQTAEVADQAVTFIDEGTNESSNLVVSECFLCLVHEDNVNYPLPLFSKELPERSQYEVFNLKLISALVRIEFEDFHSGVFTLVFDTNIDTCYCRNQDCSFSESGKYRAETVELDTCLVIPCTNAVEPLLCQWSFRAASFVERDQVFGVLVRMWSNNFSGKTLPVVRKKTRIGGKDVQ